MNFVSLSLFIFGSVAIGRSVLALSPAFVSPASSEADLIDLRKTQSEDRACFKKFDSFLAKLWGEKLNETNISDVGTIPKFLSPCEANHPKYNTETQQWLMEDADPNLKLRTCSASLFESVSDKLDAETRECSDKLFKKLLQDEDKYANDTKKLLNDEENPLFRRFLNLLDIEALLFQNRSLENFTSNERSAYDDMEFYAPFDKDKSERAWILRQECDWRDLKELREAKDDKHMLELFEYQVLRSVDRQLGNELVRTIDLAANISHSNYSAWLEARETMIAEIKSTVERLNTRTNDSQWICEFAGEIGDKFAREQAAILLSGTSHYIDLKTQDVTDYARAIEEHLGTLNDTRQEYFENFADNLESEMHCVRSMMTMLDNHHRYELATSFISTDLSYAQIFCGRMNLSLGLLAPEYCKCVGTFCVSHDIGALHAERYKLKKDETTGTYSVFTTISKIVHHRIVSGNGVLANVVFAVPYIFSIES